MSTAIVVAQVIIALGIYNVWLLRFGKATEWRGGTAKSMKEEFEVHGLPPWFVGLIGFLKLLFATLLLVGIWYQPVVRPAAVGAIGQKGVVPWMSRSYHAYSSPAP